MEQFAYGPLLARRAPQFSYARLDVRDWLTVAQFVSVLTAPPVGHFIATSGKKAVLLNTAAMQRFGTDDIDFVIQRWTPMLKQIGIAKLALVVEDSCYGMYEKVFEIAGPMVAQQSGVDFRAFPASATDKAQTSWFEGETKVFEMPTVIDRHTWARADCVGVAFLQPENGPPGLGLIFKDADAAAVIFDTWRRQLGERDERDILRVAIVEGEIPGKPSGYTMTIQPNVDAIVAQAAAAGGLSVDVTKLDGWKRRMNTPPSGSPHLQSFKQRFAERREYALVPVVMAAGDFEPKYDKRIVKRTLHLRNAREITGANDPDAGVLS